MLAHRDFRLLIAESQAEGSFAEFLIKLNLMKHEIKNLGIPNKC